MEKKGSEKKVKLVTCVPPSVAKRLRAIANKSCAGNLSYLATKIYLDWLTSQERAHEVH